MKCLRCPNTALFQVRGDGYCRDHVDEARCRQRGIVRSIDAARVEVREQLRRRLSVTIDLREREKARWRA